MVGVTTVTYTALDIHGNDTTCVFTVTVVDDENPIISGCPSDIIINSEVGVCNAIVTWVEPTATDNCNITFTSTHQPGDTFPVGVTTVIYTAVDSSGNSVTCEFDVTVEDNEDPQLTCPNDITQPSDVGVCLSLIHI